MALGNISAEAHVMSVLQKIKAAALHDALLVLPFAMVSPLHVYQHLCHALHEHPLTCRILFFMLKTHHRQIVANRTMRTMLDGIRANLRAALKRNKDEMGYNVAALKIMGMQIQEKSVKEYVDENWDAGEENVKKRAFMHIAFFKTLIDQEVTVELKNDIQSSVKNVFIRGSVVRYVHLPRCCRHTPPGRRHKERVFATVGELGLDSTCRTAERRHAMHLPRL
ncbi:unnamed protein product [Parascedosporium putredinis]|uniref:Small-subunit processome Utp12 domain-containing protein n=1 Tax=Parascedosporium putredinis TaxID=1442378 RepID=A0A9P1H403_9PEZI|nr:unnamed protein product [Parascedosporium putredinis]CAI7997754.1 unnamed protein product [Parascedosporium putredinis]